MSDLNRWDPERIASLQRELDAMLERVEARNAALTPEEQARLDEPTPAEALDPDLDLIANYLSLDMTIDELIDVEDRLETDEAFRRKVAPIIWLWELPVSLTPPAERKARAGSDTPPSAPPAPAPAEVESETETGNDTGKEILYVDPAPLRRTIKWTTILAVIVPLLVALLGWYGLVRMRHLNQLTASVSGRSVPASYFSHRKDHETRAGQFQKIDIGPHVHVRLRPMSRLTVGTASVGQTPVFGALQGEAVIDIDAASPPTILWTSAGLVLLTPGRYAVRTGKEDALVTIDYGEVRSYADSVYTSGFLTVTGGVIRRAPNGQGFPPIHDR